MIGRRGLVLTLSSIRSSNRLTVEACSIMASGVVKTILSAVEDDSLLRTPFLCSFARLGWPAKSGEEPAVDTLLSCCSGI